MKPPCRRIAANFRLNANTMDIKIDNDTDRYCTALLIEIAALDGPLSKKLTRQVKSTEKEKMFRKLAKVAVIYFEYYALYERAAQILRRSPDWRTEPDNPAVSAVYRSVYKFVSQFRYPGSVESKYEKTW